MEGDEKAPFSRPPGGPGRLTRVFLRAPIWLDRLHLGRLMGRRIIVITHKGRRTGKTRRTAVEVVDYDASTDEVFVVSAYGARSDWYQNILHSPPEMVGIAGKRFVPEFRTVPPGEERDRVARYYQTHTSDAKFLARWFLHADDTEEAFVQAAAALPMVAFRPRASAPSPKA